MAATPSQADNASDAPRGLDGVATASDPPSPARVTPHSGDDKTTVGLPAERRAESPPEEIRHVGQLGRYLLISVLGRGGMGEVWRGYDPELKRYVAIKVLRPDRHISEQAVERFIDEGRALARLTHPDIVRVFDCGRADGKCFLVSEFIEGGTLAQRIKKGSMPVRQAVDIVSIVCEAAHHAHSQGLVHRDIKPSNILLRKNGRPILCDFGLAISEETPAEKSAAGTYCYMAPEQIRGETQLVDCRSDVYSLGVVLYELLTRRLPFVGKSPEEYWPQALERDPRPPRTIREDIPADLEQICLKCLARERSARFMTARDVAAALEQHLAQITGRRPAWVAVLTTIVLLGLLAATAAAAWNFLGGSAGDHHGDQAPPIALPPEGNNGVVQDDADALPVKRLNLQEDVSVWKVQEDRNAVHISSTDRELLVLGEYQGGRLSFDVELQQRGLAGRVGLFLGQRQFRMPESEDPERKGYLVWKLERLSDGRNQMRPLFEHFGVMGSPKIRSSEGLAGLELPPLGKGEIRLGFTIDDNRLAELWISDDGERYSLKEPTGLSPLFEDCRGPFGLYCDDTNALFLKPRIDERERRLLAK